ncbi:hypothetical protein SNE40_021932 [Patella caerulea]|uniref:Solute carrier family 25 member 51 n=1 Tax=Patella caerulea TaxID=87958 RepID=A0AAN8G8V6_PATCE
MKAIDVNEVNNYAEVVSGGGAAFINITVTFPINKAMFRQQLYGISSFRAIGQLRKEGFRNLYRGLMPPLMQKTTSLAVMFGSFYRFQRLIDEHFSLESKYATISIAAMGAGTLEGLFTPFERVQVLMQDKKYHKDFKNTIHAFKELRTFGIREYYRGFLPILLRNGPSNVLFFVGRDYFQESFSYKGDDASVKIIKDFVGGAVLGALISTTFYPMNVVKTRMQSKVGGDFCSFHETFRIILKERDYSVRKLFRGYHLNYIRSFVSWGVINASFELLMTKVFNKSTRV